MAPRFACRHCGGSHPKPAPRALTDPVYRTCLCGVGAPHLACPEDPTRGRQYARPAAVKRCARCDTRIVDPENAPADDSALCVLCADPDDHDPVTVERQWLAQQTFAAADVDAWECPCGNNTFPGNGFGYAAPDGTPLDDDAGWDGQTYVCADCGRYGRTDQHDPESGTVPVLGRRLPAWARR